MAARGILERVAAGTAPFLPSTTTEYFGLQLARELGDVVSVNRYLDASLAHSESHLALALADTNLGTSPARPFLAFQEALHRIGKPAKDSVRVVGIRVEKRVVAVVLLVDGRVDRVATRDLSSNPVLALKAIDLFIRQSTPWFGEATIALEVMPRREVKRNEYYGVIVAALRDAGLSLWEVERAELIRTFGDLKEAALTQVRRVSATIWPTLAGGRRSPSLLDAAALALFVHVRKRLSAAAGIVWGNGRV